MRLMKTSESALQADVDITAREFNKRHEWDIHAAIDLAKEVLTDANAHQECRYLTHAEEMENALQGARSAIRKALPFLPADHEAVYAGEWLDEINEVLLNISRQ